MSKTTFFVYVILYLFSSHFLTKLRCWCTIFVGTLPPSERCDLVGGVLSHMCKATGVNMTHFALKDSLISNSGEVSRTIW